MSHDLPIQVLFHQTVGHKIIILSKCLLYWVPIRCVFPAPVGPVNIAVCGCFMNVYFLVNLATYLHKEPTPPAAPLTGDACNAHLA